MPMSSYGINTLHIFTVYSVLLVVANLFLIVKANRIRQKAHTLLLIFEWILSFALFQFFCVALKKRSILSEYSQAALEKPLWVVVLIEVLITAVLLYEWYVLVKIERNRINTNSLREGLDNMPAGITFSTSDGIPLLVNSAMKRIIHTVFHSEAVDIIELDERFRKGDVSEDCTLVNNEGGKFLILPDKSVWNIVRNMITVNDKKICETLAYDITEQYNQTLELEKRNRRLEEVNKQLKNYSENLDSIVRESEILAAKIRVHDDLGRALLALRSYLSCENYDREELVNLWHFTVSLLKGEAVEKSIESSLDALIKAGDAVGVTVKFDGELSQNKNIREVAELAIHECITNTVKHANGTTLLVKTYEDNGKTFIEFTNDGEQPKDEITEKGGLKNLRNVVENHGAEMGIKSEGQFMLVLAFPQEVQNV